MAKYLDLEGLGYFWDKIKLWVHGYSASKSDLDQKQETLVSGQNIKTINNESILGSGNIDIQGGTSAVDSVNGKTGTVVLSAEDVGAMSDQVAIPTKTSDLTNDSGFITGYTETDPTVPSWAKQLNKPTYNYSEIGNTPDLSGFITKSVNDLTNYYLKSETYTKGEVAALIGAIQQFHYEIYASLPQSGESNVLYLIGPTGSGSDKYEEYVYANNAFVKIGDTSIDLSGYVTTSALNTALADYTTTANLTTLLAGKQDTISDLATIRSGATLGATAYQKPNTGIPASDLASGVIPTNVSSLTNDANYITGMTILSYGGSTWNDFLTAYSSNKVVYCRASSNSNPATGSQTRLAFMAYVNNETNPTEVEFQYYRSVSTHTASQLGDLVYVYKLEKTAGWTVTTREAYTKIVASGSLTSAYSSGVLTITGPTIPTNISTFTNDSNYVKYYLCQDETEYNSISPKDSGTLYLIPES